MRCLDFHDHRDHRGFVVNPFEGLECTGTITNCHAFSINPGCSRGGHSHPDRNEKVLLLSGEVTVITETARKQLIAPAFLEIAPGEFHSFQCNGGDAAAVLCWSDGLLRSQTELSG